MRGVRDFFLLFTGTNLRGSSRGLARALRGIYWGGGGGRGGRPSPSSAEHLDANPTRITLQRLVAPLLPQTHTPAQP
jgi:hypothetical protein